MAETPILPWTYSGLLDDALLRYGEELQVDADFFQRAILRSVLFNGPILLNDGYILNSKAGIRMLLEPGSFLRIMLRNGYVRLISRAAGAEPDAIASIPETLARNGVTSAKEIVSDPSWPEWKAGITDWVSGQLLSGQIDPWPRKAINAGNVLLFDRVFGRSAADLGLSERARETLDRLQPLLAGSEQYERAPRSAIEDRLTELVEKGISTPRDRFEIMNIANQAYHYNISLCLNECYDRPVAADTTIGRAFDNLLQMPRTVEAELDELEAISIPKGFPLDRPELFSDLVDTREDLFRAKLAFIRAVEAASVPSSNAPLAERVRDVKEATAEYRARLAEHFGKNVGIGDLAPRRTALVSWVFSITGGRLATASGVASLATSLANSRNRLSGFLDRVTRDFNSRVVDIGLDPNAGETKLMTLRIGEVTPRFSSVAFNPQAIADHLENVPAFSSD